MLRASAYYLHRSDELIKVLNINHDVITYRSAFPTGDQEQTTRDRFTCKYRLVSTDVVVHSVRNNGYRCCCHNSWHHYREYDSIVEAVRSWLAELEDDETEQCEVIQLSTGLRLCEAQATWLTERSYMYSQTARSGHMFGASFEL